MGLLPSLSPSSSPYWSSWFSIEYLTLHLWFIHPSSRIYTSPQFWLTGVLLAPIAALLPDFTYDAFQRLLRPRAFQILQVGLIQTIAQLLFYTTCVILKNVSEWDSLLRTWHISPGTTWHFYPLTSCVNNLAPGRPEMISLPLTLQEREAQQMFKQAAVQELGLSETVQEHGDNTPVCSRVIHVASNGSHAWAESFRMLRFEIKILIPYCPFSYCAFSFFMHIKATVLILSGPSHATEPLAWLHLAILQTLLLNIKSHQQLI